MPDTSNQKRLLGGRELLLAVLIAVTIATLFTFVLRMHGAFSARAISTTNHGSPQIALKPIEYNATDMASKAYFILAMHANEHIQNHVRVINAGTAAGEVQLFPVDATTGQTGGAVYEGENMPRQDVGAWLSLDQTPFVLAPGQSRIVPFELNVPQGTRAGQHLGGIVAKSQPLSSASATAPAPTSKINLDLHVLTVIAVQVTTDGGEVENLAANSIQAGTTNRYQDLLLSLHNTGNMMLKPSGSLQITNREGKQIQNIALSIDTFLPGTSIDYPVYIPRQALAADTYQATLILHYGHQHILRYQSPFTINAEMVQHFMAANHFQAAPPVNTGGGIGLPLWSEVALGMFALLGIFFAVQQVRRFWHR